jgi:hypothetical protein
VTTKKERKKHRRKKNNGKMNEKGTKQIINTVRILDINSHIQYKVGTHAQLLVVPTPGETATCTTAVTF